VSPPAIPFQLLEPWLPLEGDKGSGFEAELAREMRPDHILSGSHCRAMARRCDCDDVLFQTDSKKGSLVVVHLTWSGKPDQYPQWPSSRFFASWEDFKKEEMLPEHQAYTA
jgi:hypothetical protein